MGNITDREPAAIFGAIGALIAAVLAALVAFGVDLTTVQINSILVVVAAVAPLATALGIRFKVFSPATHEAEVKVALMTPPPIPRAQASPPNPKRSKPRLKRNDKP